MSGSRIGMVLCCLTACATAEPAGVPVAAEPADAAAAGSAAARWAVVQEPRDLGWFEVTGETSAAAGQRAAVTSPVRARVLQVHVQPGDRVQAGQPVLEIASPDLAEAAARHQSAGRRAEAYRRHADELRSLERQGLVRRLDRFEVEARLADLQAERAQAQALLRGAGLDEGDVAGLLARGRTMLRAPIAGTVLAVQAVVGAAIEPGGGTLVELAGSAPPRVVVRLLRPLPDGARLTFESTAGQVVELAAAPTATAVDPSDGSLLAWYALAEPTPLPAGLRGRVRIAALPAGLLEVPARAVLRRGVTAQVLRRRGAGHEATPVEVVSVGAATTLVRGLAAGDEVMAEADRSPAATRAGAED